MNIKTLLFLFASCFLMLSIACSSEYTCSDLEQNQGEIGIDCGGPCPPCTNTASCSDGVQNGGELGVDCGGPCPDACETVASCFDGIQNQGEEGIDCGGPCPTACEGTDGSTDGTGGTDDATFTATITPGDIDFTAMDIEAVFAADVLGITGSTDEITITIVYVGTPELGTFPFDLTSPGSYGNVNGSAVTSNNGSITFTEVAGTTVSGTFTFTGLDIVGGGDTTISGAFDSVSY